MFQSESDHADTNLPTSIELGGIDERVHADVEKGDKDHRVVAGLEERQVLAEVRQQIVDVHWQPRDGVENTHDDHRFDDVRLDPRRKVNKLNKYINKLVTHI